MRESYVAVEDAQTKPSVEEFALGMGQRRRNATAKDAQTKFSAAEYVGGTGHIAMHKMHLLRLDQNSR
jgi:hypothetical protein